MSRRVAYSVNAALGSYHKDQTMDWKMTPIILQSSKDVYTVCVRLKKTTSNIEQHCCTVFWTCQGLILPMIWPSQVKFIWNFIFFSSKLWSNERYSILHMTPHAAAKYANMGAIRQPGVELRQYENSPQLDLWMKNCDWNGFEDSVYDLCHKFM